MSDVWMLKVKCHTNFALSGFFILTMMQHQLINMLRLRESKELRQFFFMTVQKGAIETVLREHACARTGVRCPGCTEARGMQCIVD